MQQYYPVYNQQVVKNNRAKASFVLSIISLVLLVSVLPFVFVGGILMSMASQSPQASGVDLSDAEALEAYDNDSSILATIGIIVFFAPPILSGISAILGMIFGIFGLKNPYNRGQATAGIVMSSITIFIGGIVLFALLM